MQIFVEKFIKVPVEQEYVKKTSVVRTGYNPPPPPSAIYKKPLTDTQRKEILSERH
jgi:hypothetical protein